MSEEERKAVLTVMRSVVAPQWETGVYLTQLQELIIRQAERFEVVVQIDGVQRFLISLGIEDPLGTDVSEIRRVFVEKGHYNPSEKRWFS